MKIIHIIYLALVMSSPAFACGSGAGWPLADKEAKPRTIEQAEAELKAAYGLIVERSGVQARCGDSSEYLVKEEKSDKVLGLIPVHVTAEKENDGRELLARVQMFMRTPVDQLLNLRDAQERFYEDSSALKEELGLSAYVPNALPIEERTENKGQLYIVYPIANHICTEKYFSSPGNLKTKGKIPTLEYVPGRTNYSKESFYQTGDLRRALFGDAALRSEFFEIVRDNVKNCRADEAREHDPRWIDVLNRLNYESAADLKKTGYEQFKAAKGKVVAAAMLTKSTIAVDLNKRTLKD